MKKLKTHVFPNSNLSSPIDVKAKYCPTSVQKNDRCSLMMQMNL